MLIQVCSLPGRIEITEALDKEQRRHAVRGASCIWNFRTWGESLKSVSEVTRLFTLLRRRCPPSCLTDVAEPHEATAHRPHSGPCFADGLHRALGHVLRAVYWHESITHPGTQSRSLRLSEVSLGTEDAQERWGVRAMALTSFYQSSPFHLFLNDMPLIVSFLKILILKFIRIVYLDF